MVYRLLVSETQTGRQDNFVIDIYNFKYFKALWTSYDIYVYFLTIFVCLLSEINCYLLFIYLFMGEGVRAGDHQTD